MQPRYTEPTPVAAPRVETYPDDRRIGWTVAAVVALLAILLVLLVLLGRGIGLFDGTSAKRVTIPSDLVGTDQQQAQTELQNLGLKTQVQTQQTAAVPGQGARHQPQAGHHRENGLDGEPDRQRRPGAGHGARRAATTRWPRPRAS